MEQYAWLTALTLAQVIYMLVNRKKYNPHPPGESNTCVKHGEAISSIKTDIGNLKERLDRIEGKLNGRIKL